MRRMSNGSPLTPAFSMAGDYFDITLRYLDLLLSLIGASNWAMTMNSITEGDLSRVRNAFEGASKVQRLLLRWCRSSLDGPLIYGKPLRLCVTGGSILLMME